jgi:hypothetical protein
MEISIVRDDGRGGYVINDKHHVANHPGNRDFGAVQEWMAAGNTPDPFVPVPEDYKTRRRREYPEPGDQLDVLWKQFNQMRFAGTDLIQEADDMLGVILAVKARHPKSE